MVEAVLTLQGIRKRLLPFQTVVTKVLSERHRSCGKDF